MGVILRVSLRQISPILQWILRRATEHGYISLTALTFVDGTGLPVPAELSVLALAMLVRRGDVRLWPAIAVAAGGNAAGSLVPYGLARLEITRLAKRVLPVAEHRRRRLEIWVSGYGVLAIVVTRVTGILRLATIVMAGLLRMRVALLVPALYLGAVLWLSFGFQVVQGAGITAKHIREGLRERLTDLTVLALLIVVVTGYLILRYRSRNTKRE